MQNERNLVMNEIDKDIDDMQGIIAGTKCSCGNDIGIHKHVVPSKWVHLCVHCITSAVEDDPHATMDRLIDQNSFERVNVLKTWEVNSDGFRRNFQQMKWVDHEDNILPR